MRTGEIITIIVLLITIPLAYWLISPLFIEVHVDEPLPVQQEQVTIPETAPVESQPEEATRPEVEAISQPTPEPVPPPSTAPPKPQTLKQGEFVSAAHQGEGTAKVLAIGDQRVLRFEDFKTDNGPDLKIYLATDDDATDFVDLGPIKATSGNVNYQIPKDTDLDKYDKALVWCRAFSVLFTSAELK